MSDTQKLTLAAFFFLGLSADFSLSPAVASPATEVLAAFSSWALRRFSRTSWRRSAFSSLERASSSWILRSPISAQCQRFTFGHGSLLSSLG